MATVGNLGRIAEVQLEGREQPRDGNYLYGAFGGDFPTADGRRVMVVALTGRQWKALKEATGTEELFDTVAAATGHDFRGEAGRYKGRDLIRELLTPWFAERTLEQIRETFAGTGVSWGPYQTFKQLVEEDPRCSEANPMFTTVEHPVGTYLTPASPLVFSKSGRLPARPVAAPGRAHRGGPRRARRGRRRLSPPRRPRAGAATPRCVSETPARSPTARRSGSVGDDGDRRRLQPLADLEADERRADDHGAAVSTTSCDVPPSAAGEARSGGRCRSRPRRAHRQARLARPAREPTAATAGR